MSIGIVSLPTSVACLVGGENFCSGVFVGVADRDLIVRLRTGDRDAFSALLERHQRAVFGYLRARVVTPVDAEDMTQEVFIRFFEARARFDTNALVRPWLLGIARNLLREHVRDVRRRREVGWTELCLELETVLPVDSQPADDAVLWLPQCFAELGPSAQQAIDGHYRAGQKVAEIAQRLHRSEGAVKLLLHRARMALRDCLNAQRRKAGST